MNLIPWMKMVQIFGTATSLVVTGIGVGTGASKYSDIVTQGVNTLANGSTASLDDKLNAYQTLDSLLYTRGDNGLGVLSQTNMNDCKRAANATGLTNFAKGLQQVASQYCNMGMPSASASADGSVNIAQTQLDTLARFTPDQQKMIFVAMDMNIPGHLTSKGKDISYVSLDAWKTALKNQATAFDANSTSGDTASSAATTIAASVQSGQSTTAIKTNAANKSAVALPT